MFTRPRDFSAKSTLAQDLANAVMRWEKVPPINLFKKNTAAFIDELPSEAISNAAGDSNYVRVQVLTPVKLIASTGPVNASIDVTAAGNHGVAVVHTGYRSDPTVEFTWR